LVELKILKGKKSEGLSVYLAKKNITINSEGGVPVLEITNEYGNSRRYEISDSYRFDSLLANLWQFVKDSQH
jgi:hypothetical protein